MSGTTTASQRVSVPAAGWYRLDPERSRADFRTRHLFGLARVSGTMSVIRGEVSVDPSGPEATVSALLSTATFNTGSDKRDRDVRSAKFLDSGTHPHITFRAAGVLTSSADGWTLAGELTVRGVTRPVTLTIESVEPAGGGFRARAIARIDRYAFGLTAARGMAARHLDVDLTVRAQPR